MNEDTRLSKIIEAETRGWSQADKTTLMRTLQAKHTRAKIHGKYAHPAIMAKYVDPTYVITPAIDLISRNIERILHTPYANLLVTMSPQEGKSNLCSIWTPIRALQLNPDRYIAVMTYADSLAEEHSFRARDIIGANGTGSLDSLTGRIVEDKIGLSLRQDRSAVKRWRVNEGDGGVVAVGLNSGITGRRADLIVIDDPYKNSSEADSAAFRNKVLNNYQSVVLTRRSPGANTILIQTRWNASDLAGHIISEQAQLPEHLRTWTIINIPAISQKGIPDALCRPSGIAMDSARGRTREEFESIRTQVGERVWFALYEGQPTPPSGGLFHDAWFENHRMMELPKEPPVAKVVAVDPCESGEGDEAGIVAASLYGDGTIVLTHDRSEKLTSDQWARAAVSLALEIDATELAVECYTAATTYTNVVKAALQQIRTEANDAIKRGNPVTSIQRRALMDHPFRIHRWRGSGDAVVRSALLRQGIERGTTRVHGYHMVRMQEQAKQWQQGQHQPDRVAAAVIADDRLLTLKSGVTDYASPVEVAKKAPTRDMDWLGRSVG